MGLVCQVVAEGQALDAARRRPPRWRSSPARRSPRRGSQALPAGSTRRSRSSSNSSSRADVREALRPVREGRGRCRIYRAATEATPRRCRATTEKELLDLRGDPRRWTEDLGPADDLFENLGIDSLQALELLTKLEEEFGIEMPGLRDAGRDRPPDARRAASGRGDDDAESLDRHAVARSALGEALVPPVRGRPCLIEVERDREGFASTYGEMTLPRRATPLAARSRPPRRAAWRSS